VRVLGGIVGGILGFTVSVFFTEVIFASNKDWPGVFVVLLTVIGAFLGAAVARRLQNRTGKEVTGRN
jgi:uncharacterized membrane protein YfcA